MPDPVLAEIGAARTGAMREIVATIQAEQDVVIRAPLDQCLVVQGGPGTGKTAVGLHRAAYLLFEHRRRLARDGVLVVGPNRCSSTTSPTCCRRSASAACTSAPRSTSACRRSRSPASTTTTTRRWKGAPEMLDRLAEASIRHVVRPTDDLRVPIGARTLVVDAKEFAEWIDEALDGVTPGQQAARRLEGAGAARAAPPHRSRRRVGAVARTARRASPRRWPTQQPIRMVDKLLPGPSGKRRTWTVADQFLVDEANSMLNGTPFTFGHVVVDEAQDHSAVVAAGDRPAQPAAAR